QSRLLLSKDLSAVQSCFYDRGDVMVVDACSEKRHLLAGVDVPGGQLLEVRDELRLREGGLEVELAPEANALRNLGEELLDGRDSDRREHLLAVPVGQRKVAHCSAKTLR